MHQGRWDGTSDANVNQAWWWAKRSVYKSRGDGAGFGGLGVTRRMNEGGRIQGQPKRRISKSCREKG